MEDDAGVKAPVTRLRRRLSVEQSEENKSPALNTPTKKRGGRRAKPELELIDENTPENSTKKTKKTATKEIKDAAEEKPVTPSRRSTRIKSNTSIVSETAVNVDSPRAKRAARRTSAVGSDSEAPLTPIRQTRRTRKDSASSLDKAELPPATKPVTQITEIIVEEPENNERKSISNADKDIDTSSINVRKSPRLVEKSKKNSPKSVSKDNKNEPTPEKQNENMPSRKSIDSSPSKSQETNNDSEKDPPKDDNERKDTLSTSSTNLIKDMEVTVGRIKTDNLNKTISNIDENNKPDKSKRKRTKSWTTLNHENESNFYSDNESSKKKIINKDPGQLLKSGSGDTSINKSLQDKSLSKRKNSNSGSFIVEDIEVSANKSHNKSAINEKVSSNINNKTNNDVFELFKKGPSVIVQSMVLVDEDSDSNHGKNIQHMCESGDQCVPVVEHPKQIEKEETALTENRSILNNTKDKSKANLSCEPMDVDETIPESLIVEMENNEKKSSQRNSVSHFPELNKSTNGEKINKSKRKSSISNNLEKSGNENKSTLILSQIKDASSNEINVKSPRFKNEILSKTVEDLNVTQENEINKKNISLSCVTTSTPLQQKTLQKLALNANTSIISPNYSKNIKDNANLSKNNQKVDSSDENDSDKEVNPDINDISTQSKKRNESKRNTSRGKEMKAEIEVANEKNNSKNKSLNSSIKNISLKQNDFNKDSESEDESLNIKRKIKHSKSSKFQTSAETDSDSENESTDESDDNSNLLDDKTSDAGDDYQSGDSQNEEEREYMNENEILEKGETLTSEDEFSDDSDYEKDSFVVSSAEEDNELLDGTKDDLSMSDNELKMTAKSKKKYNERKQKEQKMASKEMFESRHKLNNSVSGKTKKNKKQKLSSSESDSESEPKLRKNNRMRLDSTNETSMLEDDVDKKTKRLSASVCEESIVNEKEITIANQSIKEIDPLITVQVKEEPKTPKKENTSIAFINSDEMNIDVDTNEETKTQTEIDPLDASEGDDDENVSLSSDTEIMQNYDSMLEGLSKNNKKKTKTVDISLNLDKKTKKLKMPIVDELNLTHVKSTKKNKKQKTTVESKVKNPEDDGSSDSIDLHLLFSEDSNISEDVKQKDNKEDIIQLKRKEGKMDIRDTDTDSSIQANNTSLNVSLKKNKKRKSIIETISTNETEETNVSFFMDTEGTHKSLNESVDANIKREGKTSIQENDGNESDEAPIEVSFLKAKKNIDIDANREDETDTVLEKSINKSIVKTPGSEKKKKKNKQILAEQIDNEYVADTSLNVSLSGNKKKKSICDVQQVETECDNIKNKSLNASVNKNKSKSLIEDQESETSEEDSEVQATNVILIKTPSSQKKKSRISEIQITVNENDSGIIMNNSFGKKRNKSLNVEGQTDEDIPVTSILNTSVVKTPGSQKKKKNSSESQNEVKDIEVPFILNTSVVKTPGSQKKKKNSSESQNELKDEDETLANKSITKTPSSGKKKKKLSQSICDDQEAVVENSLNISKIKTPGSQKKQSLQSQQESGQVSLYTCKIKTPGSQKKITQVPLESEALLELHEVKETSSKKRKRKASLNKTVEELNCEDGKSIVSKNQNESLVGSQKKKLKVSENSQENIIVVENQQKEHNVQSSGDKKKKKLIKQDTYNIHSEIEIPGKDMVKTNRNKRKQREDDDENTVSKILKQNSFDKKVPRLPATILNQLDDNPKKEIGVSKKAKVAISTTQFLVEEAKKRKNKPSNFLEESVYLNDDETESRKVQKRLPKPKVLPFVPTASTSGSGYTTDFKVNIIPRETKFIAQSSNISNFKEDYILNKKIKRQGTYELYKRNRNIKISKF